MTPGKLNLVCPQGSTFTRTITYSINGTPVDLTSYTARMQVRRNYSDKNILGSATCTINGPTGQVTFVLSAATTADMPAGKWVYDLEIESAGGVVSRLIEGRFTVTPEVTR